MGKIRQSVVATATLATLSCSLAIVSVAGQTTADRMWLLKQSSGAVVDSSEDRFDRSTTFVVKGAKNLVLSKRSGVDYVQLTLAATRAHESAPVALLHVKYWGRGWAFLSGRVIVLAANNEPWTLSEGSSVKRDIVDCRGRLGCLVQETFVVHLRGEDLLAIANADTVELAIRGREKSFEGQLHPESLNQARKLAEFLGH